ncbi:MAG: RNase adapter RapZ [Rhodospirillaceae bacterium]|jgi:RNase adapter protein RapZ|nr:RNase adapter RapZ [Rhodospirillaceae bacterium]MBT5895406.1 RNase adapter RapZ [Rhodospirillaceae bacterium]MBT6428922.1 RNase adapter RapZ [Rhodospirillaceae bacterium]MBT7758942.1 RNase adapter RapZ [Rhodospirillaceae bacterium]
MTEDQQTGTEAMRPRVRLLLITGLSGAGRTLSLKALEDVGFEAIDNLPLSLIGRLLSTLTQPDGDHRAIAIAVDFRQRDFSVAAFDQAAAPLAARDDIDLSVVFLDCDTEVLARRFTETRRRHPLGEDRPVMDGIMQERQLLAPLKDRADLLIDTSNLTVGELRALVGGQFRLPNAPGLAVSVLSFSYRQGLPREADLVFDVRFLANPHYVDELRPLTGRDPGVGAYIAADPSCEPFLASLDQMLQTLLPLYLREGKSYLTVAIGCTGGRHRSVYAAEELTRRLAVGGHAVTVRHRDADRT